MDTKDLNAEKSVLGAMLISNDAALQSIFLLLPEDFADHRHQVIFEAMINLYTKQFAIDTTTVAEELTSLKKLALVGGMDYLLDLINSIPEVAEVDFYLSIVKDRSLIRHLINTMDKIKSNYEVSEIADLTEFVGQAEKDILAVTKDRRVSDFTTTKQILDIVSAKLIELRGKKKKGITGLDTGYPDINQYTQGFQPGDMILLAARPSVGKTALAINLAMKVAEKNDCPVAIFSLEMTGEQIFKRMLSIKSQIESWKIQTGEVNEKEWLAIEQAGKALGEQKIFIGGSSGIKMMEIRTQSRKLQQKEPNLGLIVIDYLGLIGSNSNKNRDNRQQEVSDISREVKAMARELNVPVLALCQLSRNVESRKDHRPELSDLRESGSLEQDADQVFFIYREDYNQAPGAPDGPAPSDNVATELILRKNRNGKAGVTIPLVFMKQYGIFESSAHDEDLPPAPEY